MAGKPSDELRSARAQALHLNRLVKAKKRRLADNNGVNWGLEVNRKYDVSVDPKKVERYTLHQAEVANARMRSFLRRSNQLYGDIAGRVLPPKDVAMFRAEEEKWIRSYRRHWSKFKDLPGFNPVTQKPDKLLTMEDNWWIATPSHSYQKGAAVNPLQVSRKKVQNVTSRGALIRLAAFYRNKNQRGYWKRNTEELRKQFNQAIGAIPQTDEVAELRASVNALDDKNFELMWMDRRFADAMSLMYEILRTARTKPVEAWEYSVAKDAFHDMEELKDWANSASSMKEYRDYFGKLNKYKRSNNATKKRK